MKVVLNVGGGKSRLISEEYAGWKQVLLDINPKANPDICLDAKELKTLEPSIYDAVYSAQTLEHFYDHEVPIVLAGFYHVLRPNGIVDVSVPNITSLLKEMQLRNLDIDDVYYRTPEGVPVKIHDVLYGWAVQMEKGNLFYAHRCGFTAIKLYKLFEQAGFINTSIRTDGASFYVKAFKPLEAGLPA